MYDIAKRVLYLSAIGARHGVSNQDGIMYEVQGYPGTKFNLLRSSWVLNYVPSQNIAPFWMHGDFVGY